MLVPFDSLPNSSRIWVFTASKKLTNEDIEAINSKMTKFISIWHSHNMDVYASFIVVENRFLILAVDELKNEISGCGIDKSFHSIKELEDELSISLSDKSLVIFEKQNEQLSIPFNKIKSLAADGTLSADDFFYNTLSQNLGDFKQSFKILAKNGWVKKYFLMEVAN